MKLEKNERIFFNGDSITDACRDREDIHSLSGYVKVVADVLQKKSNNLNIQCFNRGISGNKACDIVARIDKELEEIKPTIFVMLIGINDVWRKYDSNDETSADEYANNVENTLKKVKTYTNKIILLEPFLVNPDDKKIEFYDDLYLKILKLRTLAKKYNATYIALDGKFAEQSIKNPNALLSPDNIHLTDEGNEFVANEILKVLSN